jgi:hypothetical protein
LKPLLVGACGDFDRRIQSAQRTHGSVEVSAAKVTIQALSARLGLTVNAIRRMEQIGAFPGHLQGSWAYLVSDVDAWLDKATSGAVKSLDDVPNTLAA